MQIWKKGDWRAKPRVQMPEYTDTQALELVEAQIAKFPPLVFAGEVRTLRQQLAAASCGEAFVLQGGDCAESFESFSADRIRDTFRVLLQMAMVLTYGAKVPVVKLGRLAGQFAKPRSEPMEKRDGLSLPSYRGDIINDLRFSPEARSPDPSRMLQAYTQSAATLNLLRAFSTGGFADMTRVHAWTLEFTDSDRTKRYRELATRIQDTIDFMSAVGINADTAHEISKVDFFTSHEALLLEYEEALTRIDSTSNCWLAGSGHMLWIGDRTRQPDGAHIEFARGVINPIGVKCGSSLQTDDLKTILHRLNPHNEAGRITLITRLGADQISHNLPPLVQMVKQEGFRVTWVCDPMHGNTIKSSTGFKTRSFESVLKEVRGFFAVHASENTIPGGVHIEMTGDNVTECVGGIQAVTDEDLHSRYHTACDPRLNASQSLELAFLVAEEISFRREEAVNRLVS